MAMATLGLAARRKCNELFAGFVNHSRAPRLRSMLEFAEQEIIVPDGPYAKRRFKSAFQPWSRLWLEEMGKWQRHVLTGPRQGGKSFQGYIIPGLYHLFEIGEKVICMVPRMEMAFDKWRQDFEPAIRASRYANLIPDRGKGSRGGDFDSITFLNGATLKFMSGKGDDKSRVGYTARVVLVTEVDGMDEAGESSRETDPIGQVEECTASFGDKKRIYLECTVSVPTGRIWREYESGTASKLVLQCNHCSNWVTPEREHFCGWDGADTELKAEQAGQFFCPDCGGLWDRSQREHANRNAKLIHRGQKVLPSGEIEGALPETRTLSLRWTATNNLFYDESLIGREEWKSSRQIDREAAEKKMQQFFWCIPYSGELTGIDLSEEVIASRLSGLPRGVVPDDYESLVCQIDLHNRWHYWTVLAASPNDVFSVVDYGLLITPNVAENGPEVAIRLGLEQLAEELSTPGRWKTQSGKPVSLDMHFIDAGYMPDIGLEFVARAGDRWRLIKGEKDRFAVPKESTAQKYIGDHWIIAEQPESPVIGNRKWFLILGDTNHWMRQVHGGFQAEVFTADKTRTPGSIALFGNDAEIHRAPVDRSVSRSNYATQLMGWKWGEITTKNRGTRLDWIPQWKEDHWFDTTYGCLVAASFVKRKKSQASPVKPVEKQQPFTTPDGRPYLVTERN